MVVVCATGALGGDCRTHDRRRDGGPDASHQPSTCATRHSSPVRVRVRRSSLIARSRTSETLAVTCSLLGGAEDDVEDAGLGDLAAGGQPGRVGLRGPLPAAWWRSTANADSVSSSELPDLVGDERLRELPGDLAPASRWARSRGAGGAGGGVAGLELGPDPLQQQCVRALRRGRDRRERAARRMGGGMVNRDDRTRRPGRERESRGRGRERCPRLPAPRPVGVGQRPGEPGLDQPLQRLGGATGAFQRGTRRVASAPEDALLEAPGGLADQTTRPGRPRHEGSCVISRLGRRAARY